MTEPIIAVVRHACVSGNASIGAASRPLLPWKRRQCWRFRFFLDSFRCAALLLFTLLAAVTCHGQATEAVQFAGADGKLQLAGYLYLPDAVKWPGPRPAVVMLHGRSGLFSAGAKTFGVSTLSSRTVLWGRFWAERGYVGLYVDSFAPRGYPRGFEAGTNDGRRPPEVNEVTVRPFDAYAGLDYLRTRKDVQGDHVFLQGWSNGGSATLSSMADRTPAMEKPTIEKGFRAAIAVYPGCTPVTRHFGIVYRSYAPLLLLIGTEDEEVSFRNCEKLARSAAGEQVTFVRYQGATHSYDTPTAKRRAVDANVAAAADTRLRAEEFFGKLAIAPPVASPPKGR